MSDKINEKEIAYGKIRKCGECGSIYWDDLEIPSVIAHACNPFLLEKPKENE